MSTIIPSSEGGESVSRVTVDGRKLTYQLRVIQQPERARACGSGAKSSADRRPVDPPPVVELRIFEGDAKNDITFSYNANFFLYASLEVARPIAHGRMAPSASAQIPVLTGMPVSGMAYLDRPMEAGYFIFPDLSVRHEGKYRLQFNLYEETKDAKDCEPDEPKRDGGPGQNASFNWRLEVKSAPFTVYSAKKFPGLAESTPLSRTVAEQGCRVRIRRDVRMRRRDGKNAGEYEEDYDDFSRPRTRSPEPAYNRVRSASNASGPERPDPYAAAEKSSRSSVAEYPGQSYQNNYAQPPAPLQGSSSAPSYLSFGASSNAPQYQAPSQYAQSSAHVQPIQPSQQYQPAQASYDQNSSPYRHGSISGPSSSNYAERPPYQQYPSTAHAPRESYEQERRPSAAFSRAPPPIPPPPSSHYNGGEPSFRNPSSSSFQPYPPQKTSASSLAPLVNLAPLKMPALEPRLEAMPSPSVPLSANRIPNLPRSPYEPRPSSYLTYPAPLPTPSADAAPRSAKRTYDAVFSSAAHNQPLHNGNRPSSSHRRHHHNGPSPPVSFDDDDDDDDDCPSVEELKMQYKRADGTAHSRTLPNLM